MLQRLVSLDAIYNRVCNVPVTWVGATLITLSGGPLSASDGQTKRRVRSFEILNSTTQKILPTTKQGLHQERTSSLILH